MTTPNTAELDNLCAACIKGMRNFYSDPANIERFEKWKRNKEDITHDRSKSNH